ncbi:nicotinate-nucleotide adenylyltransferase [Lacrimispora saccharolytica]|nr:nicotinate-nucleotide adenylyltransferase [Lacrimispora saccharolytica]
MEKKSRKIGIMGGTFDPIHIGHLILGEGAYEQFGLSEVWFMPAGNPPHKQNRKGRATDAQRVEMVKRAIAGNPHFALCMAEMNADGFTYSYRTLETLNRRYPDTEFYFILGADSLFDFHKWREPGRICAACKIVVATRNQVSSEKLDEAIAKNRERFHGEFLKLDTPNLDISSGNIRDRIRDGQTVRYYLPDSVIAYMDEHHLYRQSAEKENERASMLPCSGLTEKGLTC